MATKSGYQLCPNTIARIMKQIGTQVTIYSKHVSGYHSYKGKVGTVNSNLLHQKFDAKVPFSVLHTDITQVKLANHKWGYISAIIDEASREVITAVVSESANKIQLYNTLNDLKSKLPIGSKPIMHSDQGWQYQTPEYQETLANLKITPSMSRKGNCLDNAPIESFFSILKREKLNRQPIKDIEDLKRIVSTYVKWFNNKRISMNKKGLTSVECRNQVLI